ncbi:MAG: hypothetical protein IJ875_07335, partial [Solobacterium sp.]|nr:hypothetical protein [Solobacterium sp.]
MKRIICTLLALFMSITVTTTKIQAEEGINVEETGVVEITDEDSEAYNNAEEIPQEVAENSEEQIIQEETTGEIVSNEPTEEVVEELQRDDNVEENILQEVDVNHDEEAEQAIEIIGESLIVEEPQDEEIFIDETPIEEYEIDNNEISESYTVEQEASSGIPYE